MGKGCEFGSPQGRRVTVRTRFAVEATTLHLQGYRQYIELNSVAGRSLIKERGNP